MNNGCRAAMNEHAGSARLADEVRKKHACRGDSFIEGSVVQASW
jgi:hypothetical protein